VASARISLKVKLQALFLTELYSQVTSHRVLLWTARGKLKKHILMYGLLYGLAGGLLIVVLKLVEYRFLVLEHSVEIYGGLIALVFASLGIWLGLKITRKKEIIVERELIVEREVPVFAATPFAVNGERLRELAITRRELEILELIATGMSNREIADKLFVSENTVKTHSSRLFDKLSAKRRTQAVQIGKELGLIP
jgi:DNA-binding CsgD family transcriptional regulator